MRDRIKSELKITSVVMSNLDECPFYNGSVFLIDDTEVERIVNAIDAAIDFMENQINQPCSECLEVIKRLEGIIVDTPYPINPVITDPQGEAEYAVVAAYRNAMMQRLRELGWVDQKSNYGEITGNIK